MQFWSVYLALVAYGLTAFLARKVRVAVADWESARWERKLDNANTTQVG